MARLGGIAEALHDARRGFWHLRHEGPEGLRRFRERERSNIERSATLAEICETVASPRHRRGDIGPLRERVAGRYLRRAGLIVFTTPESESRTAQEAREIGALLGMDDALLERYRLRPDGDVMGPRGLLEPGELALVLKSCEAAVLSPDIPFAAELAECGTAVLTASTIPKDGRAGLERLGYIQRIEHIRRARAASGKPEASVSAVVATNRPAQLSHVLAVLGSQIRQPEEILVGTHGFEASEAVRALAHELGLDVAWIAMESEMTVGGIFASLISRAQGDWIAKMDDDDFYGREYIADALWTGERTGAALVGKNAAYAYLEQQDETVVRFAGRELIETYHVLGPTLFTPREVALEVGYPDLARSDDTRYVRAVGEAGGKIVASARFGFAYMRHGGPHVWAEGDALRQSARLVHAGMPDARELPFAAAGIDTPAVSAEPEETRKEAK